MAGLGFGSCSLTWDFEGVAMYLNLPCLSWHSFEYPWLTGLFSAKSDCWVWGLELSHHLRLHLRLCFVILTSRRIGVFVA